MNILLKLMSVVALVIAPLLAKSDETAVSKAAPQTKTEVVAESAPAIQDAE